MPWFGLRPAHTPKRVFAAAVLITCLMFAFVASTLAHRVDKVAQTDISEQARRVGDLYYPTRQQWTALAEPVSEFPFRAEHLTEGARPARHAGGPQVAGAAARAQGGTGEIARSP